MLLDLSSLEKAISSLTDVLAILNNSKFMNGLDSAQQKGFKSGVIQNFEFTYELCWKFIKRWLEKNLGSTYIDGVSRRELFRLASEHQLIQNVDTWMNYHQARNLTTHTYDEEVVEEILKVTKNFLADAKYLLTALQTHND